jgi:hypothetical protein
MHLNSQRQMLPDLCGDHGCRRIAGHRSAHDPHPTEAWGFFETRDRNKITKAGFATPRGGAKGAYQNHVIRNNKVILPYERLPDLDLSLYKDGYVIRLLPDQYFGRAGLPKPEFLDDHPAIRVGDNAFVLYRTHDSFERFPPLPNWQIRSLYNDGVPVNTRRGVIRDTGHFVLRIPRLGDRPKRVEGPPQGLFAPEYADVETNYLCKCVLSWLIIQTQASPYTLTQARHIRAILQSEGLDNVELFERNGMLRRGLTCCPLCTRFLKYNELHETVSFEFESGLTNASEQIHGATRSTVVNLFHLMPLLYHDLTHIPANIGWGHAICNTRLGQRPCYSLPQLMEMGLKVGIVLEDGLVETFGWISEDWLMIRSPNGAVWIQLNGDIEEGPPEEPSAFDVALEPVPQELREGDGDGVEALDG